MNDLYEILVRFAILMWCGYCIIMGFTLVFSAEEFIDIPIAIFCTWVLMILPVIIRGKW